MRLPAPGLFDFDAIGAGGQIRQVAIGRAVGDGFATDICGRTDGGDLGVGN